MVHEDAGEEEVAEDSEGDFRGIYRDEMGCRRSLLGDMMGLKNLSRNSLPDPDHPGYVSMISGLISGKGEKSSELSWTANSSAECE